MYIYIYIYDAVLWWFVLQEFWIDVFIFMHSQGSLEGSATVLYLSRVLACAPPYPFEYVFTLRVEFA